MTIQTSAFIVLSVCGFNQIRVLTQSFTRVSVLSGSFTSSTSSPTASPPCTGTAADDSNL